MKRSENPRAVVVPTRRSMSTLRLYCFAQAGAGSAAFRRWAELGNSLELAFVRYPGRESRLGDPLCTKMSQLVAGLIQDLDLPPERPYAFFGFCLGALVALEVARRLPPAKQPAFVAVAGAPSPVGSTIGAMRIANLPDEELMDALGVNAVPAELRDSPEMRALILPALRADLQIAEDYEYRLTPPLASSLIVLLPPAGESPIDPVRRWDRLAAGGYAAHAIEAVSTPSEPSVEFLRVLDRVAAGHVSGAAFKGATR